MNTPTPTTPPASPAPPASAASADPGLRRILVIDDNDAIHHDFRKILTDSRPDSGNLASAKSALFGEAPAATAPGTARKTLFTLDSALQGQIGLEMVKAAIAENRPYSVAFVDMRMPPGWDGLQTIERLWEVDSDLQVVICTAYSDYSWDDISAKLGLTDRLLILKKPFDSAEVSQLATALSEKWVLQRNARLKLDRLETIVENRTQELTFIAHYDKLTGLPNRAMFTDELTKAVDRAKADPSRKFAFLFIDFDRFKSVNDSLGHSAGDELLQQIAARLGGAIQLAAKAIVAERMLAGRLGGDEFVVLLDGLESSSVGCPFADGLLRILASPYHIAGREVRSSASIGITTSDQKYQTAADVLRDADTAMYNAKAAGKARFVLFDRRMHDEVLARLALESDLRFALERNEFTLHYQPIVSLTTGLISSFEALVRWNHPERGIVAPGDFIPCCEEIGHIVPVGYWVLGQACRQLKAWDAQFPSLRPLTMAVNLSAKQLADPNLLDEVRQAITSSGINPAQLALEITESAVVHDAESAIARMRQLRQLGVRLHLDDFGTGYSSLNCLHQYPLDGLKIDRSFIRNIGERRDYTSVVQAIIALARNLKLELIAEGIETPDQVVILQMLDCDYAQGFHFDRPRDAAGASAYIDRHLADSVHRAA